MKNNFYCRVSFAYSRLILFTASFFCSLLIVNATPVKRVFNDSAEKRADYLQKIYFSGENKEGINMQIMIALQEIQTLVPTFALGQQATFLLDIQDDAAAAKNACDILDLLAVGIYSMDAAEAKRLGVNMPSDNAKKKSVNAIENLQKLSSTSHGLSGTASNASWNSYLLSGGKYGKFSQGAGKAAATLGKAGSALGAAGELARTGKDLADLGKSLGVRIGKKDNSCKDVGQKDIAISERKKAVAVPKPSAEPQVQVTETVTPAGVTTVMNIAGISYNELKVLTGLLKDRKSVESATQSFDEKGSTIAVVHTGSCDELAEWVMDNFGSKYKLLAAGNNKIDLQMKK